MEIRESRENRVVVLAPVGDWDADSSAAFKERSAALLGDGIIHFVVDFGAVTFMDSSALVCLISLFKRVKPTRNGDVKLFGMRDAIREIFSLTRLDQVFDIHPDLESLRGWPPEEED